MKAFMSTPHNHPWNNTRHITFPERAMLATTEARRILAETECEVYPFTALDSPNYYEMLAPCITRALAESLARFIALPIE